MEINVAEAIQNTNMYELASKTIHGTSLTDTEQVVVAELDAKFREIGRTGYDKDHEISQFVQRVLTEELYNAPDELLDEIFDRDEIGANDDFELLADPKNTLVPYEAAPGGNVPKSYLDVSAITPKWVNRQIDTEISYQDLERGGWKTVAKIVEYAVAAFKNAMCKDIFTDIDNAIASGADNYVAEAGATISQATADAVSLYLNDWAPGEGKIVGYTKYIQNISKLSGFNSDAMLDELHRNGSLGVFQGCALVPISAVRKQGDNTGLFIDKRLFGIAGVVGKLSMRGEIKTYQTENNNKEKVEIKIAGFNYGWAFNSDALDRIVKVVVAL